MSVGDGIGIGLGRALQDFGRAMYEDHQWKERRKMLAEEARAELEAQRKQRREDLKYEASLNPPQIAESEEIGEDGKRVKVQRQWEPDFERGGGQYRELGRMPVMAKPEGRPFEVVRGGNRATIQRFDDGTEKVLGEGPRWNPSGGKGGEGKSPSPSWARVEDPDNPGSWLWMDRNSGKYSVDAEGRRVKADPPYREREGRKSKDDEDEDNLLAPKRPTKDAAVDKAKGDFAEENKRKFPGAPPIGTVEDGMEYMGGDPANENNWRPAR